MRLRVRTRLHESPDDRAVHRFLTSPVPMRDRCSRSSAPRRDAPAGRVAVRRRAGRAAETLCLPPRRLRRLVPAGHGFPRGDRPRRRRRAAGADRRSRRPALCRAGQRPLRAGHTPRHFLPRLGDHLAAARIVRQLSRPRPLRPGAGGLPRGRHGLRRASPAPGDAAPRTPAGPTTLPRSSTSTIAATR